MRWTGSTLGSCDRGGECDMIRGMSGGVWMDSVMELDARTPEFVLREV